MNYYNPAYPYNYNPYLNQSMQMQPQSMQMQQQPLPQQNLGSLNGKIVDSADVVKATEVPMGGYGIFPKADLSEVYIKSWNNNGTTSIITFKPVVAENPTPQDITNTQILERLNVLDSKIESLVQRGTTTTGIKKEAKGSDY